MNKFFSTVFDTDFIDICTLTFYKSSPLPQMYYSPSLLVDHPPSVDGQESSGNVLGKVLEVLVKERSGMFCLCYQAFCKTQKNEE